MNLHAQRGNDTAEIRALLRVAEAIGPQHHEYPGLVRGAEVLRTRRDRAGMRARRAAEEREKDAAQVLPEAWTQVWWMWPSQDRTKIHAIPNGAHVALCAASSNRRYHWSSNDGGDVTEHVHEEHMREQMCKDCTRRALALEAAASGS